MRISYLIACYFISTFSIFGQNSNLEKAKSAVIQQEWKTAIDFFLQAEKENALDSQAVYFLAKAYLEENQCAQAIPYFDKAIASHYNASQVYFGKARCYGKVGNTALAIESLDRAAEGGLILDQLQTHPDLDAARTHPRWSEIFQKAEQQVYPCLTNPVHRKMDFWLGEWEVHTARGIAGNNVISRANGGCAIHESYTTPRNYSGQSINYYDPMEKKWRQNWVGSSGDVIQFIEIDSGEGMIQFSGTTLNGQGKVVKNRMTFTYHPANDTVTQLIESTPDEGISWNISFQGLYKRKQLD